MDADKLAAQFLWSGNAGYLFREFTETLYKHAMRRQLRESDGRNIGSGENGVQR